MKKIAPPLPPSASLPPLGRLSSITDAEIVSALENLSAIYCPFPTSVAAALTCKTKTPTALSGAASPVDSGYASETDGTNGPSTERSRQLASIRGDSFERDFTERWLCGLIARIDSASHISEDIQQLANDRAASILESLFNNTVESDDEDAETTDFTHNFSFNLIHSDSAESSDVQIQLRDKLAGTKTNDHDDVGLQVWGASIMFSELLCASPLHFGLDRKKLSAPRIVDMGAGAGLVSLVLGTILPRLGFEDFQMIATDYHPAVIDNLRWNIEESGLGIEADFLDWAAPTHELSLEGGKADILIATDVVYAHEHAILLRDCASRLLAPVGVFWLLSTVRENGRFGEYVGSVEAAFGAEDAPRDGGGRVLRILEERRMEKRSDVGRKDESRYELFKIGWS